VETSQRIVDVLFGAFAQAVPDRVPAAGKGTMNNLLIRADGSEEELPAKGTWQLGKGARVRVETPGGGRWGTPAR
jgi:N-methylhydantoinase B